MVLRIHLLHMRHQTGMNLFSWFSPDVYDCYYVRGPHAYITQDDTAQRIIILLATVLLIKKAQKRKKRMAFVKRIKNLIIVRIKMGSRQW